MAQVLVTGCGYVGTALAARLAADGHNVWGLRRRPDSLPRSIRRLRGDLTQPESLWNLPRGLDFVFYTAAAGSHNEESYRAAYVDGLRNLLAALEGQGQTPRRAFFSSSTAVYAQCSGEWVDESSPTEPAHFSGRRLLEAERLLLAGPFAATVVRYGGIYGPERTRLIDSVRRGTATSLDEPPVYTNRIHRDDCVGVLYHLMNLPKPESIYIAVDHELAERGEVLRWLAEQLGVSLPEGERASDVGRPAQRGNKRCRNAKLLASGYVFRYPTYREGYGALLSEEGH